MSDSGHMSAPPAAEAEPHRAAVPAGRVGPPGRLGLDGSRRRHQLFLTFLSLQILLLTQMASNCLNTEKEKKHCAYQHFHNFVPILNPLLKFF